MIRVLIVTIGLFLTNVDAFSTTPAKMRLKRLSMHFEEALLGNTEISNDALPRKRYVATNRFNVRNGQDAKFEKRWAERTSRIANLPGFKFFTLLRRVQFLNADYSEEGIAANYISLTVWEDKEAFDEWRTGDAFKEAHGGGGITDFIKLLSTALFILNGGPKPAFFDGLLPINGANLDVEAPGGWRNVIADGENLINPDVFVAMNRFKVAAGQEVDFERVWANRDSELNKFDGFVFFTMMRRDASTADDGYNYISMSVWRDRQSFESWQKNQDSSHGQQRTRENESTATTESSSNGQVQTLVTQKPKLDMKKALLAPPKVAFYEGKLALMSKFGA